MKLKIIQLLFLAHFDIQIDHFPVLMMFLILIFLVLIMIILIKAIYILHYMDKIDQIMTMDQSYFKD